MQKKGGGRRIDLRCVFHPASPFLLQSCVRSPLYLSFCWGSGQTFSRLSKTTCTHITYVQFLWRYSSIEFCCLYYTVQGLPNYTFGVKFSVKLTQFIKFYRLLSYSNYFKICGSLIWLIISVSWIYFTEQNIFTLEILFLKFIAIFFLFLLLFPSVCVILIDHFLFDKWLEMWPKSLCGKSAS